MLATERDYAKRVKAGKAIETRILEGLRKRLEPRGIKLEIPTAEEDKKDKIDLWITNPKGKRYSVQIKYRETGDDVIFEVIKDIRQWLPGRDAVSVADLYFFVDRTHKGWLYWAKDIKAIAEQLTAQAKEDLRYEETRADWLGDGYEMKRRHDHATGDEKLVAFIKPRKFPIIETFDTII